MPEVIIVDDVKVEDKGQGSGTKTPKKVKVEMVKAARKKNGKSVVVSDEGEWDSEAETSEDEGTPVHFSPVLRPVVPLNYEPWCPTQEEMVLGIPTPPDSDDSEEEAWKASQEKKKRNA